MVRKLIGACVGLAMMGMAGTAKAIPIVSPGNPALFSYASTAPTPYIAGQYDIGISAGNAIDPGEQLKASIFDSSMFLISDSMFINNTGFSISGFLGLSLNAASVTETGFVEISMVIGSFELNSLGLFLISAEIDPETMGNKSDRFQIIGNQVDPTPAPEPSTLALFATGLALLAFLGWRRRRAVQVGAV